MPTRPRYQDKAREFLNNLTSPIKMEPAPSKPTRPAVAREATRKETRFLLSIIANNVQGLQEGFAWHAVAIQAGLKALSATLALQTFSDLKASLAITPLEDDLKEATLEELDAMIAAQQKKMMHEGKKLEEMMKERELKRAMREEQDKLEVEERVLREKRESLRERTMVGLKRKREVEVEGMGKGKGLGEEHDVKVKKEKLDEKYETAEKRETLDEEDEVAEKHDNAENNGAEAADKVSEEDEVSEVSDDSDDSVDWYGF